MKKQFLFIVLFICVFSLTAQTTNTTTYYLIRHAEKVRTDKTNKNPNLTAKGHLRANNWSVVFENVNFDLIYATNYNRTKQTAAPTATSKNLEILYYSPKELYNSDFQEATKGKTVLVVGHSNTTPQFVNAILNEEKYQDIDDKNNANLYIVTVTDSQKSSTLIKVPYSK
ncbi:SixA phosphatase family protein [Lutibacter holmesii]|uniref:SixA phosphatase family protein n=1 Tax=Lutibacter holmesii TaxID=1137985 RepID=A0ABW3WQS2_9FLAO